MVTNAAARSRAILIWVAATLVLDIAGAKHVYTQPAVAAALLSLVALLWLAPEGLWQPRRAGGFAPTALLALLPVAAFAASMVDLATFVPPLADGGGWTSLRLWALAGGIVALLVAGRHSVGALALVAIVLGTGIRMIQMEHIAIVPANGDMLPLVDGALRNLLAGQSPYMTYKMPWDVPLTYLPVTWLAYLPTYLLGVDLRWTNIAAELALLGAVAWLSRQRGADGWRAEPAVALWAWLFLQPSVIHWDAGNTAPITWALLGVTLALTLACRPRGSAVALGLTAAGTPLVAVFGPFVGLFWLRRYGFWTAVRLAAIAGIVAAVFVVPFFLWEPTEFRTGVWRWFNNIDGWPRQKWLETDPHVWSIITGFSGEFWSRGTQHWLKPIQAVIVALALLAFWLRGARATQLCAHAAAAYLGFMLFNPVLWPYLYNPVLVAGLVGVVAVTLEEPLAAARPLRAADTAQQPSLT